MLIGYARVSTSDQTLNSQEDDLRAAGCERIFTDVASGSKTARPGLAEALDHLRKGDTLVVWRLDRLGRSLKHLIETVGVEAAAVRKFTVGSYTQGLALGSTPAAPAATN